MPCIPIVSRVMRFKPLFSILMQLVLIFLPFTTWSADDDNVQPLEHDELPLSEIIVEAYHTYQDVHPRGRNQWTATLDGGAFFGSTTRSNVFFGLPATSVKTAGFDGCFGVERIFKNRVSVRLRGGYQHVYYASIGIAQIHKSYALGEMLFSYYPLHVPVHWDPYVTAGPMILVSGSGGQGYLGSGVGTRFFITRDWSLRLESLAETDFSGVRGDLLVGVNYHF